MSKMAAHLVLLLLSFSLHGGLAQNYGDLRLLQGERTDRAFSAGRLEIYINSTWGSICSDNFDLNEANVACRQLGYQRALSTRTSFHTPYGRGTVGPIWLDEVDCRDQSIQHLLSCANVGVGVHDCDHFSDVAVVCEDVPLTTVPSPLAPRLRGGNYPSEGRVEVYCDGRWSAVCDQLHFGQDEANAVCRDLGYTEASGFDARTSSVPVEELGVAVWPGQLRCEASPNTTMSISSEEGLASCGTCSDNDDEGGNPVNFTLSECSQVVVRCAHTVHYGSIRLAAATPITPGPDNDDDAALGRLEIFRHGRWGTVCSDTFDFLAANISCKELGFVRALDFGNTTFAGLDEAATSPVLISGVRCSSDDQTLNECLLEEAEEEEEEEDGECTHTQDVALTCTNLPLTFPPMGTGIPPTDGPKLPVTTFVGIIVGSCLGVLLVVVCCAVCSVHFYLVPYDRKKERHSLYFIEREGSVASSLHEIGEAESDLDQKLSELDGMVDPFEELEGGGRYKSRHNKHKNRYVTVNTSQRSTSGGGGSAVPQPEGGGVGGEGAGQPVAAGTEGTGAQQQSDSDQPPLAVVVPGSPMLLQRVSMRSIQGSPMTTRRPSQQQEHQLRRASSKSSTTSLLSHESFSSRAQSQEELNLVTVPIGIPIPPPLKYQQQETPHDGTSVAAAAGGTPSQQATPPTPTRGIIKSPKQSRKGLPPQRMHSRDEEGGIKEERDAFTIPQPPPVITPGACADGQQAGIGQQTHRVSFALD